VLMKEQRCSDVASLPFNRQLAAGVLVFERMLPSLIVFSRDTGLDISCYERAREAAWLGLRNGTGVAGDRALNEECLMRAPDTENFTHKLTSYALNAALAMSEILEFSVDHGLRHIKHVLELATDSAYLYAMSPAPSFPARSEFENRKIGERMMSEESRRQQEDIDFVRRLPDRFDEDAISLLRTRANSQSPLLPYHRE